MKGKLLNIGLILSSLIGYLEWGQDKKMFLFEGELDIMTMLFSDPLSVIHPFTLLPMVGQILLIITLFQKRPGKILTFIGFGCIAILLLLMFVISLIGPNFKTLISTLPFMVLGIMTIRYHLTKGRN